MKIKTKKVIERVEYQCDFCEETALCRCSICARDICYDHTHSEYDGDYTDDYCLECWETGKEFRKEIYKIEANADLKIERLKSDWEKKCMENKNE